jgi:hypothetical protein
MAASAIEQDGRTAFEGSTMARGEEDRRSFPTEIWLSIVELKGLHYPIESSQVEGAEKANFVGVFPVVGGLSREKLIYTGVIRFIPPLYSYNRSQRKRNLAFRHRYRLNCPGCNRVPLAIWRTMTHGFAAFIDIYSTLDPQFQLSG